MGGGVGNTGHGTIYIREFIHIDILYFIYYIYLYRRYILLYSTRSLQKLFLTAYKSPEFVINPRDLPNKNDWERAELAWAGERAEKVERFSIQKKGPGQQKWDDYQPQKQVMKWWKNDGKWDFFLHMRLFVFVDFCWNRWVWYSESCQNNLKRRSLPGPSTPKTRSDSGIWEPID